MNNAQTDSRPTIPHTPSTSIFEQIGGAAAVQAAVELFYRKVLLDDRISHFFEDVDMDRQLAKQSSFLTFALGGPNTYTGRDMKQAHAHLVAKLGLNDTHFDAVAEHLGATLRELGVAEPLVGRTLAIAESVREDVLGRR